MVDTDNRVCTKMKSRFMDWYQLYKRDFSEEYASNLLNGDKNSDFFATNSRNHISIEFINRIKSPKIFQFSYYPAINNITGGERRINSLRKIMAGLGWNLSSGGIYKFRERHPLGSNYVELTKRQNKWVESDWREWEIRLGYAVLASDFDRGQLKQIFNVINPDVLLIEHPFLWPIVKHLFPKVPVIYDSHNVEWQLKSNFLQGDTSAEEIVNFYELVERDLVRNSSLVFCCSDYDFSVYKSLTENLILIPNGANNPTTVVSKRVENIDIVADRFYIIYISSPHLPNWTGVEDFVLPVMKRYEHGNKINLILAGGICSFYEEYCKRKGKLSNVTTINSFSDEEKAYLFSISSLIILPIVSGGGTNLKTAEALLSTKRILASETAFRGFEVFKNSKGVSVVKNDNFADAFDQILSEESSADQGSYERPECQVVSWDSIVGQAISDINKLIIRKVEHE